MTQYPNGLSELQNQKKIMSTRRTSMWLILYRDGTYMTWRQSQPKGRDFQPATRLFEVDPETTLIQLSDWSAYNYPEVEWAHEIKEW